MGELPADLMSLLVTHALPASRVLGIMIFLPGFGSMQVPAQVRLVIAGATALLVSTATTAPAPVPTEAGPMCLALVSELGLGFVVGWAVSVFFESLRWAGEMLDMQIGLRASEMFDPLTSTGSSLLGQIYFTTATTFFFVIDGHHWILAAVGQSFARIPPGQLALGASAVNLLLGAATSALDIAVRMAGAGMAALLLTDVALGVVSRHVPQMNVFMVGMPGKLGVGLLILAVNAPFLGGVFGMLLDGVKHTVLALLVGR